MPNTVPKYVSVAMWLVMTGMTRTATYKAIANGGIRAIKQQGADGR